VLRGPDGPRNVTDLHLALPGWPGFHARGQRDHADPLGSGVRLDPDHPTITVRRRAALSRWIRLQLLSRRRNRVDCQLTAARAAPRSPSQGGELMTLSRLRRSRHAPSRLAAIVGV